MRKAERGLVRQTDGFVAGHGKGVGTGTLIISWVLFFKKDGDLDLFYFNHKHLKNLFFLSQIWVILPALKERKYYCDLGFATKRAKGEDRNDCLLNSRLWCQDVLCDLRLSGYKDSTLPQQ